MDGLGRLIDDYDGDPATLRWLSIHPDRRVVDRVSGNRIGWSTALQMWVQVGLLRDVFRLVDPTSHGHSLTAATLIHTPRGMVVTTRQDAPVNPIVTGMLAELGVHRAAHGTVAWLAEANPGTGLHGDLDDQTRAALRALAARHGAIVSADDNEESETEA